MGFKNRKVAVVGVYMTEQARNIQRSPYSLQVEAIRGALDDAGLTVGDVDGLAANIGSDHHNAHPMINSSLAHMYWAEQLGGRPLNVAIHGGGSAQLPKAAAAIASGMADVVLMFFGKSGFLSGAGHFDNPTDTAPRVGEWDGMLHGAYLSTWYALWAQRYMHEFSVPHEDLAEVAVLTRHHAVLNPDSVMGRKGEITVADVLESRPICSPLNLLDCSIDNDGAYAVVLASEDVAKDCKKEPVWVLGAAESYFTDFYASIPDPWFTEDGQAVRTAGDRAFAMSGLSRDEMDVANLYDCFTITTIRDLEEMRFCKLGEGAAFIKEGNGKIGGSMPLNTDGGRLSGSHCGEVSGLPTIEVVRQLRGECGERQVPNAKTGVSLSQGFAVHGVAGVMVLATD